MQVFVKNLAAVSDYSIRDITGRKVLSGTIYPGSPVHVAELSPGIYCLVLKEMGMQETVVKFIKSGN